MGPAALVEKMLESKNVSDLGQILSIFPYKSIREKIWICHKEGQGQPWIIIWTNLVGPESPKLYSKFQDHWPIGSGEDL